MSEPEDYGPKCQAAGCESPAHVGMPFCKPCLQTALASYKKEVRIEKRASLLAVAGFSLLALVVLPAGCGVMVGTFMYAVRAVSGWP